MTSKSVFESIPPVRYEGPESTHPFAYRWYDAEHLVLGRPMKEWMRNAVCWWHTFRGLGGDPFGPPTRSWPWDAGAGDELSKALRRADVAFEFFTRLGVTHYCFHDRDVAPDDDDLRVANKNLWTVVEHLKEQQDATGVGLLWGTSNLFSHPRYAQGAGTSPQLGVLAAAANQVKEMLDVSKHLGGANHIFWGGREGYQSLLNTDLRRELLHLGRFLGAAADYADSIGYTGALLIEPKPCEPTKHQYDFDAATVLGFLREHGLFDRFGLNIENNHATLAGHDFVHELAVASAAGKLGSIDANRGDVQNGWDTDQFPNDPRECALAWLVLLRQPEGLGRGGLNYDAKLRRESTAVEDLFHAHIGAIDAWARGLRLAAPLHASGALQDALAERYASFDSPLGRAFEEGRARLEDLQAHALQHGVPPLPSGRQEALENLVGRAL